MESRSICKAGLLSQSDSHCAGFMTLRERCAHSYARKSYLTRKLKPCCCRYFSVSKVARHVFEAMMLIV
jgi:hypothetical protein